MVTDRQVRRLRWNSAKGESLLSAALRSGMSENTARRHRAGELAGQRKSPRQYRTRPDPFAGVWPEIEAMLEQAPGLEAVTIFEALRGRAELSFSDGQLRTLQRRIRRWRASQGPDREVFFAQQHRPGEYAQSDFTSMNELGICLGGERFEHLFFHFVLPYSNLGNGRDLLFGELRGVDRRLPGGGLGVGQGAEASSDGQPFGGDPRVEGWSAGVQ